jgi:hypothetical protein
MDNSLLSLIDAAASILVLSIHDRKDVSIYCPSPMMVGFNRLIGVNKISQEVGKKNLVIKFVGYEATNIDKVGYDIENGEFKLTVTPKAGFTSPEDNQIKVDHSGASADLVILVGGANDSHFPILSTSELANAKIAHIGTRVLDTTHEVFSFAKPASTTSELIASAIKESGLALDTDVASDLVMGIEDGSNNFAGSEVTPETFEMFAYLLRNGGQRMPRIKLSPASFPPGAIPQTVTPVSQVETQAEANTPETGIETPEVNPPTDWLQPKIFKGTANSNQPTTFSENKG